MSTSVDIDDEDEVYLRDILNMKNVRHPEHGHAFYPMLMNSPRPCIVCGQRCFLIGKPCRCLLCNELVHRKCYTRAIFENAVPKCEFFPEELPQCARKNSTNDPPIDRQERDREVETISDDEWVGPIEEDSEANSKSGVAHESTEEDECGKFQQKIAEEHAEKRAGDEALSLVDCEEECENSNNTGASIADPSFHMNQMKQISLLAGATLVGGALGGPAGALLGANGAAKAGCAVAGATFGYRRVRRHQLDYRLITPAVDGIPTFWAKRAKEICNRASIWTTPVSYNSSDQAIQLALDDCNLDERVNIFVAKLLLDPKTIPGALYEGLVEEFHLRHTTDYRSAKISSDETVVLSTLESECIEPEATPVLDALGLIHEILSAVFQYHLLLAQNEETIIVTINAVDRVVLSVLYEKLLNYLALEHCADDEKLNMKLIELEVSTLIAGGDALRALEAAFNARIAYEKLICLTRFVECISEGCKDKTDSTADDLLPAICSHLVIFVCENIRRIRLHAELAFIQHFSRNDTLLLGREGYALTSVRAAVTALSSAPSVTATLNLCRAI